MKIVYFGTPQFAAEVLEFLLKNKVQVVCVITKPDKPKGRSGALLPTPVKLNAQKLIPHVPLLQPELVSALEVSDTIKAFNADLFVVVAYGEIIKQHLLDMPRLGCINLHASLLPKHRGAAPIQKSIIDGDAESGVTIMHMVKKMDAGDMIKVIKVPIDQETTYGDLEKKLFRVGSQALLDVIHDFEIGKVESTPQDHSLMTLAPKIELEDCELNWGQPAQKLHDLIRGVNPYPGAWCYVHIKDQNKRVKILTSKVIFGNHNHKPGAITSLKKDELIVACGTDALQIMSLQPEGKKIMSAKEFLQGAGLSNLQFVM